MAAKMEKSKLLEEKLRENCCIGDEAKVKTLLDKGVDVNAANSMNGWTPLHWAAKRGHQNIVKLLLNEGALTTSKTKKGETPGQFAGKEEIRELLGVSNEEPDAEMVTDSLPIVPNYIKNPPFIYLNSEDAEESEALNTIPGGRTGGSVQQEPDIIITSPAKRNGEYFSSPPRKTVALDVGTTQPSYNGHLKNSFSYHPELVLKVRVANLQDKDFIEIELDYDKLTFDNLLETCCSELEVDRASIRKVRKLPNTIVRKDKDVGRLQHLQELEIVQYAIEDI